MAAPVPAEGRIHGRADTEVGARWLEDAWDDGAPVGRLLAALHDTFGGQANLAVLDGGRRPYHYAGNGENPVFTFRLGRIELASTGIYSLDRSLFRYVARGRDRPSPRPDAHDGPARRRRARAGLRHRTQPTMTVSRWAAYRAAERPGPRPAAARNTIG